MTHESVELRSCERELIDYLRRNSVRFGTRRLSIRIEYQDGLPVLVRILESETEEEKLK